MRLQNRISLAKIARYTLVRAELSHGAWSAGVEEPRTLVLAGGADAVAADAPRDVLYGVRHVVGHRAG